MNLNKTNHTALFFGSFDPVHMGHLIIAEWFLNQGNIEDVWFVVTPVNPLKNGTVQTPADVRVKMLQLATENIRGFRICDIELNMPPPHYTINTLNVLIKKFPEKDFLLVIGGDNLTLFRKWKNYSQILDLVPVYVYPRPGIDFRGQKLLRNMFVADAPLLDISSTRIRKILADGLSARFMVLPKVYDFIIEQRVYARPNSFFNAST